MQLADPSAFVESTFFQALADLATARFLLSNRVESAPYNGRPALDAAVAKLQQAAEKALKGAILALAPGSSSLVFRSHTMLSDKDGLPADRSFRAALDRIGKIFDTRSLRATLKELEQYAPSGIKRAECDAAGNVIALPLNTEYPFLEKGGAPIAPATAWSSREHDVSRLARAVDTLFRHLKGIPQLSAHLADHSGKAISG